MTEAEKLQEIKMDQMRLKQTIMTQKTENEKRRQKELLQRQNLKHAWLEQMAYKNAEAKADNLFK